MGSSYFFQADRPVIEQAGDVGIYKLKGDVVLGPKLDALREVITEVSAKGGSLVLDFTEATKIDSSTMGIIVGALKPLEGALGIYGTNKKINDLFQVTKLKSVLNIYETRGEALEKTPWRGMRGDGRGSGVTEAATANL